MQVTRITAQNNQYQKKNAENFRGNLLGDGFDIYQGLRIDKVASSLQAVAKEASCDLIIIQNKRKGIVKFIAQKLEEFERGSGKKIEKSVHTKDISSDEMYIHYSKKVIADYEQPTSFQKFLNKLYKAFTKKNTNNK